MRCDSLSVLLHISTAHQNGEVRPSVCVVFSRINLTLLITMEEYASVCLWGSSLFPHLHRLGHVRHFPGKASAVPDLAKGPRERIWPNASMEHHTLTPTRTACYSLCLAHANASSLKLPTTRHYDVACRTESSTVPFLLCYAWMGGIKDSDAALGQMSGSVIN